MEAAPASVDQALASPGRPLEPALRQDMEQRFGYDFSAVRVHSGAAAEQSARDVNANAYTVGHNIVFGAGRFAPGTHEGRRLLAHELTHVVQQSSYPSATAPGTATLQRRPVTPQEIHDEQKLPRYQRQQLEALEGRIQEWTEDERSIARDLLRKWFELRNSGRDAISVKKLIQQELLFRYQYWLQAKDEVIQEYCHKHNLGPKERFGGGISCEPLFEGNRQLGYIEVQSLHDHQNLTSPDVAEPPLETVFYWVREYRRRTNPDQLKMAELASALTGLLSVFATPGGKPFRPSGGFGPRSLS